MKEQKKQNLLTVIIIILVLVLAMLVGSIVYEEIINMNEQTQNTMAPITKEEEFDYTNDNEEIVDNTETEDEEEIIIEDEEKTEDEEKAETTDEKKEYIGEEENNVEEDTAKSKDDKAIDLVKKEWGKDDNVSFSIEKKNGAKYRVAVRDGSTTVLAWYEVDTETWEVSEY